MTTPSVSPARRRPAPSANVRRRAARRRRRLGAIVATVALTALAGVLVLPHFHDAVIKIALPLRHEDIIRQQARDKGLDASLIAGVIYAESHFVDDRTSTAGAEGLMQLTPQTAQDIARRSGGSAFEVSDLGTPQVNIAYGSFYLRWLLDRYDGDTALALAAYNAGAANVDRWVAEAHSAGHELDIGAIPFAETRAYVRRVLDARHDYRVHYARELGL